MRRRTENRPKKRMSAEDRRKAILETTISFISQFGFWGFTIRDVAQAQNITEAGLLYYFKSKEQLLEKTLKYADRTNQIAIAEHLGVQGVTGEVLDDGIAYHCDLGLKAISTGTVETNADRPEMVRLYTLLESEALSKDHPVHEYFEQRANQSAEGIHVRGQARRYRRSERTALQVLSAMEGLQLRWLNGSHDVDFVGGMEGHHRPAHPRPSRAVTSPSPLPPPLCRSAGDDGHVPTANRQHVASCDLRAFFQSDRRGSRSSTVPSEPTTTGATTTSPDTGLAMVTSSAE